MTSFYLWCFHILGFLINLMEGCEFLFLVLLEGLVDCNLIQRGRCRQ